MVLTLVYLYRFEGYSRSIFIINAMALGLLVIGSRVSFKLVADAAERRIKGVSVLIYGAGDAGVVVVRELRNNPAYEFKPVGFIDDDPGKMGKRILGIPVLGTRGELESLIGAHAPEALIVSTTKLPLEIRTEVADLCSRAGVTLMQLRFELRPLMPERPAPRPR